MEEFSLKTHNPGNIQLDWPLRYVHSPGEVIETKDVEALGKIVEVVARQW